MRKIAKYRFYDIFAKISAFKTSGNSNTFSNRRSPWEYNFSGSKHPNWTSNLQGIFYLIIHVSIYFPENNQKALQIFAPTKKILYGKQ